MDSGVIEKLSMKISSYLDPPKPKGVHPLVRRKRLIMENTKSNYMKVTNIQEELKNVKIENYL